MPQQQNISKTIHNSFTEVSNMLWSFYTSTGCTAHKNYLTQVKIVNDFSQSIHCHNINKGSVTWQCKTCPDSSFSVAIWDDTSRGTPAV